MIARSAFASSLFLVLACPADDGDGASTAADASSGAGDTASNPTTGATTATTAPAETGGTTAPADTGVTTAPADTGETTAPADTGSSSAAASEGSGGTTGSAVDPCEVLPSDDDCNTCVKSMCCPELTACNDDPDCVCFQDCAGSMPPSLQIPQICGDMCGLDTPFQHPTVGPVLSCSNGCIISCI